MKSFLRKNIIVLVVPVVMLTAVILLNFLNQMNIGYIESTTVMQKFPDAEKARKELKVKLDEWGANQQTLEAELNELNKELLEKGNGLDKKTLNEKHETFKKKQADYFKYRKAIEEKAQKLEEELFTPVYAEINARITDFGEEQGYDIILGTLTGGNILYADKAVNLTDKFLEQFLIKESLEMETKNEN